MSTFSRTATLFSTVVLGSMLTTTTVSSVNTIVNAAETTQAVATKKNYDLKILQGNSDAASTASQFYLNTISLEKQANGNYYAYLTSNTPVNLGDEPISSEDTQHQVVKMGTTQKNGYNQTVYRLTLTADELASGQPIKTKIHVNIPMMNYDHDYDIRLAIQGFKPEAASSSSSNSSSSTANSSSSVSSSSNTSTSSTADSSTTSVAPTSSSQTSSSSQSSNNDTATSSVVNNGQNNSSDTASSTVVSDDTTTSSTGSTINIAADQGMSRFLKPTARIDVKGEQTDITLSLNDASLAKMIPSLTLDGQTKSVSGQDTTFTVPTKDLIPDKDGKLTLKSLTHVSAQGYTHDYPSNITFDVSQLIAQNNLKTGSYQIAVSPDSQMDKFFAKEFNVKVGALTSVVSVTYQEPSMMGMIPSVTFDGQTKSVVNKSTTTDFTIPTKDLVPGKDGKVTLKSFTSVPMSPFKGYNSNITFDMNPALVKSTSDGSDLSSSSSESTASSDKDILQDGTYSINYNVYKSGTTTDSTMKTYMKSPANVAVKNGQATITFATQNDAMSMMKEFSVNGATAKADGDNWVVTVPVSALSKTMTANMTIVVSAINFTEHPSADIVFDMSSVKKTGNNGGSSAASSSSASSASSSSKVSSASSSHVSSASSSSKASSASSSHASIASSSSQNAAKTDITKNSNYSVNYSIYKTGTKTDSTMKTYMKSPANVAVKNGQATITFTTQNDAMSMMKEFSVNGATAKADGDNWV
ncbi:NEAT domain-containing protein, partial [Weissella paramesenteroides]